MLILKKIYISQIIIFSYYYNITMEYQKIENLLNDESNQPSKFRTRNWVKINDEARGTYSPNKQIKFKTSMLRSSYVIIVMHIYLLKEIQELIILLMLVLLQIILIKK